MIYSEEDIKFLESLHFHLEDNKSTFYSDFGFKGRDYNEVRFDESEKKWVLYEYREYDVDNDDGYWEDWERFNNLDELKNYLT